MFDPIRPLIYFWWVGRGLAVIFVSRVEPCAVRCAQSVLPLAPRVTTTATVTSCVQNATSDFPSVLMRDYACVCRSFLLINAKIAICNKHM